MKNANLFALLGVSAAIGLSAVISRGDDILELPAMPPPLAQHMWLKKFVGVWESEVELTLQSGQPAIKGTGTESTRMLGSFWIVAEGSGQMAGLPEKMKSVMTLGFDPVKQIYVGTWVDSMNSYLWRYQGSVDETGRILTLETEGPCPGKPGIVRFREVIEFKSDDYRVFTSSVQGEDRKWVKMVTAHYRKKS